MIIFGVELPQLIITEQIDNNDPIQYIIKDGIESANKHFNILFNNRPKDKHYRLNITDMNKGVKIRSYDSITDMC